MRVTRSPQIERFRLMPMTTTQLLPDRRPISSGGHLAGICSSWCLKDCIEKRCRPLATSVATLQCVNQPGTLRTDTWTSSPRKGTQYDVWLHVALSVFHTSILGARRQYASAPRWHPSSPLAPCDDAVTLHGVAAFSVIAAHSAILQPAVRIEAQFACFHLACVLLRSSFLLEWKKPNDRVP